MRGRTGGDSGAGLEVRFGKAEERGSSPRSIPADRGETVCEGQSTPHFDALLEMPLVEGRCTLFADAGILGRDKCTWR